MSQCNVDSKYVIKCCQKNITSVYVMFIVWNFKCQQRRLLLFLLEKDNLQKYHLSISCYHLSCMGFLKVHGFVLFGPTLRVHSGDLLLLFIIYLFGHLIFLQTTFYLLVPCSKHNKGNRYLHDRVLISRN